MDRQARLREARLYLVCDRRPAEFLRAALRGGVDVVQLRDKTASGEELLAAASVFRACCEEAGALFLINDRPDLVAAAGADGVHVGQGDVAPGPARAAVGHDRLVGLSTHSAQQVDGARSAGPDYIAVGPVHATPTKPGRPAVGLGPVRHAAAHVHLPWFAIGGIDADTVGPVVAAGARRIVVVRAIADAPDPEAAARSLRAALDAGRRAGRGEEVPVGQAKP
jgi:thiamine-phosphate pyrophosphorylase